MIHYLTLRDNSSILYFGNNLDIKYKKKKSFYSPNNFKHSKIKSIYLSNSISNRDDISNIIVEDSELANHKLVYFENYQPPFNLIKINLNLANYQKKSSEITAWVFKNPNKLRLYPLSIIIWPPAWNLSRNIVEDISKRYRVVKDISFQLESKNIPKFIYEAYQDDVRCDKSKLGTKIRNITKYPGYFRYLKILVENPKINSQHVSETSIYIKKNIRGKYRKLIKDYHYDIIIHVSDNQKHTKSMYLVTQKYLKKI